MNYIGKSIIKSIQGNNIYDDKSNIVHVYYFNYLSNVDSSCV